MESLFQEKEDVSLCPESTGVDRPISRAGGDVRWWTCGIGSPLKKKGLTKVKAARKEKKTAQKRKKDNEGQYVGALGRREAIRSLPQDRAGEKKKGDGRAEVDEMSRCTI